MVAVVLTGGNSTRMGTDKGLLVLQHSTLVQTALEKLKTVFDPVLLSINKKQYNTYSAAFPSAKLIIDDDLLQIKGPLCGLLSVHQQYPKENVFLLACDMPLMPLGMITALIEQSHFTTGTVASVYFNDGEPEPLCAVYKAGGLESIMKIYRSGKLTKYSMKFMLSLLQVNKIPIQDQQKAFFTNLNTQAEWKEIDNQSSF